jgi:hypothetical protein
MFRFIPRPRLLALRLAILPLTLAIMFAALASISPTTAQHADAATGTMTIRGYTTYTSTKVDLYRWDGSKPVKVNYTTSASDGSFALVTQRDAWYYLVGTKIAGCNKYQGVTGWFYLGPNTSNPFRMDVPTPYYGKIC